MHMRAHRLFYLWRHTDAQKNYIIYALITLAYKHYISFSENVKKKIVRISEINYRLTVPGYGFFDI